MEYNKAVEWLNGEMSTWNTFAPQATGRFDGTGEVQCAQADAAMIQQAYWIVKAHKDGLISNATVHHVCAEDKTCTCSMQALEPDEECPVHGAGPYPRRCGQCGRFINTPNDSNQSEA